MTWMPVSWDFPTTGTKVHIQVNEGGVDVQLEAAGDDVGRFANDSRGAANDVAEHVVCACESQWAESWTGGT